MTKPIAGLLLVILTVLVILSGCANPVEELPPVPTQTLPADPPLAEENTPTTPPESPGVIVLLWPAGNDPAALSGIEEQIRNAADGRGLVLEIRSEMPPGSQPPTIRMVVVGRPLQEVDQLAAALADIPFLALGEFGLAPAPNLTVLRQTGSTPIQAFMAGYIAAVQSDEYRIGIISSSSAEGQLYRRAFLNGAIYFCGTCTPFYPPYETYPQFVEAAPGSDQAALQAAAGQLFARGVNIVHVAPELQTDGLYAWLAQNGVRIVGTAAPPAGLEGSWIASVVLASQGSLGEAVLAVLDGGSLPQSGARIEISYAGISEARLAHFLGILEKLKSGEIDPVGE